jgi:glutamate--cysteine ligase catalytic subunit
MSCFAQVDENMATAQQRNAVRSKKFYFRKDVFPPGKGSPASSISSSSGDSFPSARPKEKKLRNCFAKSPLPEEGLRYGPVEEEYEQMTIDEIMNGKVATSAHMHLIRF